VHLFPYLIPARRPPQGRTFGIDLCRVPDLSRDDGQHSKNNLAAEILALDSMHPERRDTAIYRMTGPTQRLAMTIFRLHPERRRKALYGWLISVNCDFCLRRQ
jgi:hypothetical protein